METNHQVAVLQPAELIRQSTDIAQICKEIVLKTSLEIQGRKFVRVEGYMAVATAHGCLASSRDVERVEGGYKAIGEVRRMSDGALLAQAEGFVGEDEPTWFGGEVTSYGQKKILPKRHDYAIRAMCQTRAISRACRSAFAHVVVLMDAGLSTTPAEEVPLGGFNDDHTSAEPKDEGRVTDDAVPGMYWKKKEAGGWDGANEWLSASYDGQKVGVKKVGAGWRVVVFGAAPVKGAGEAPEAEIINPPDGDGNTDFRETRIHFGKNRGLMLSELTPQQVQWYEADWMPKRIAEGPVLSATRFNIDQDNALIAALKAYRKWRSGEPEEPRQATEAAPVGSTPQTPHEGSWKLVPYKYKDFDGTLGDMEPAELDALRKKVEATAAKGTRNMSTKDRHLLAALTLEFAERPPAPGDSHANNEQN